MRTNKNCYITIISLQSPFYGTYRRVKYRYRSLNEK